jgi:putative N-acetylmannosamine-6-phosphate epimerase
MVTHCHLLVVEGNLNGFAEAHHVLIDGIVEHLLEQHVDAVVVGTAVTQLANVHAGTAANMFLPLQRYNVIFLIVIL